QVHNSYLVTQDEHGVVIIDQHALHERVMFEKIMQRLAAGPLESQRLLAPAVGDASESRNDALDRLQPLFARLGVEASALGPASIGVHAFPTLLFDRRVDPADFLTDLLEKAESRDLPAGDEEALHEIVDMMACKAAIKAGDHLSDQELAELLDMRDRVARSSNCPHGRPTTVRLSIRDLEKAFGRA
ncbi:MAG: DNA mismatch repair protein MutL, partial [Planctomycetota bacterium]|nr:DNA mismatch repair protein MutL [Planctomycetota bacterium]